MNIKAITYFIALLIGIGCIFVFATGVGSNATQVSTNLQDAYEDSKLVNNIETEEAAASQNDPAATRINRADTAEFYTEDTEESTPREIYLGEFRLTAYCSCEKCCNQYALNRPKDENGIDIVYGASGRVLRQNYSVAVDPNVISYGSRLLIDGHEYEAADCGGGIQGNSIDVYFASHQEACEFNVRYAEVYLIWE